MFWKFPTLSRAGRLTGVIAALLLAGTPGQSFSQTSSTQFDFDIAAQPLSSALLDFSQATRQQVAADAAAIRNVTSKAVNGSMTAQMALTQMLAGTGLELVSVNGDSFALRQSSTSSSRPIANERSFTPRALQEIVVNGELFSRNLQDTHSSVSIISGEALENAINRDLYDVIERIGGVAMEPGGFGFVIRGIKTQGQNTSAGTNAVSFQIDGVVVNDFQAIRQGPASVWDLEQVEILKGPQSTQQGQNALAGAIIMRSKDPIDEFEVKARLDYGSFNEQRQAGAVNIPLSDNWALRFSGENYQNDGDIQHWITGEEIGGGGVETYRGKLRYSNNGNFDAVFTASSNRNRLASQSVRTDEWPERRVNTIEQARWSDTDTLSLLLNYQINENWSLRSETGHIETNWNVRQIAEPFNPDQFAQRDAIEARDSDGLTEELRFTYDGGEALRWVGGLYYADNEASAISNGAATDTNIVENRALFSELEYDINEKWTGVLGLRYDNETREFQSPVLDDEQETREWLPKLGLIYHLDEDRSIGFTTQRAYRSGGVYLDSFGSFDVFEFDPEFTTTYELSYRSINLNDRLTFNANAFYTDYEDMQLFQFEFDFVAFTGSSSVTNVGQASLYGGELEVNFLATDRLDIFANAGYVRTEIEEDIAGNIGNQFPLSPRWTGSVGSTYRFSDNLNLQVTGAFTDEFFFSENNLPTELNPSYFLVDANLTWQRDNWSVSLYGRNVGDCVYLTRTRADGFSSAGDPRFVGVSLNMNF